MYNVKSVCLVVLGIAALLASIGMVAAAEDDLGIAIGAEATILPGFASDLWVDLDWNLNGLSVGSTTTLVVFPTLAADETLTIEYSFEWASLGAITDVSLYPFAFDGFDLYMDVMILDTTFGDDGTLSIDAGLWLPIFPVVAPVISIDLDAALWVLSLWSGVDFDILTQGIDALIGGEIQLLDVALDNGSLTADWGSGLDVLPTFNADTWFNVSLGLGDVTMTSQTDFALTPFALEQQRFDVSVDVNGLSIYAWAGYSPTADFFAGIGFTYDLP